jgi:hypothetical protein
MARLSGVVRDAAAAFRYVEKEADPDGRAHNARPSPASSGDSLQQAGQKARADEFRDLDLFAMIKQSTNLRKHLVACTCSDVFGVEPSRDLC